ncbi:autotransporter outer membrane beta-barrel domain-containing protein [Sphingomonas sp. BK580]|uniref:autotransporter outer membrane beta-barrel domain-containing protein n=1 Tax=Sphingomonas sp. BK580 TaxID=2586972 RepID=UPI001610FB38|nr:autotransporter outer membrane beta-barrel domain-containing protein [Sphingomonas sp. BK580]MBB3694915.1 uncharacterized protein YhjY with autotransporter beta-barrel domain [Sphingomonas sp. BK580]
MLRLSSAMTAVLCVSGLNASTASAQLPQSSATIDATTQAGTALSNKGVDHTNEEPASGAGRDGGNADGWNVTVDTSAFIRSDREGALVSIYSVGGNGSQAAQGGDGGSPGARGGNGGSSGNIDITATPPTNAGGYWAFEQLAGRPDSYAFDIRAIAGNGGKGETPGSETETGGQPGAAGIAGNITFTALQNTVVPSVYNYISSQAGSTDILLYSRGGNGGAGGDTETQIENSNGINGAAGSNGGDIRADIALNMSDTVGTGVNMTSIGGNGGQGGNGNSRIGAGYGGAGAAGGDGGTVVFGQTGGSISTRGSGAANEVEVNVPGGSGSVVVSLEGVDAAILAQSIGGVGGTDGSANGTVAKAGNGGNAGAGGTVSVNLGGSGIYQTTGGYQPFRDRGVVSTTGDNAVGVIASSVGGAGGGTQDVGGAFAKYGGSGGRGGNGGQAYVSLLQSSSFDPANDYALITTNGTQSDGVIVQSVGGGGGIGGDVNGGGFGFTVQHGGSGGSGGVGGSTGIDNGVWNGANFVKGYQIHTLGANSFGILVESIGGSGGRGGNATGAAAGVGSLVIGGNGGSGGDARDATISNFGIIQTEGDQSIGALAQSIGGGGGAGGSALAITIGSVLTSATAIGGTGGVGGNGDLAQIYNLGQVVTTGNNAIGLVAQSVGGGGGNAGSSLAEAFAVNPPDSPIPTFTLDLAIGGKGGAGGYGGVVRLYNTHLIATQGAQAFGVLAQSIGGGGGNGGDATAISQAYIQSSLTANVALGGDSGDGSTGGSVTVANSGLVQTLGRGSVGVFAQSVGGGGGTGGLGSTNQGAFEEAEGWSVESSVGIGGKGGKGGDGGDVLVYNYVNANNNFSAGNAPDSSKIGQGGILTAGLSAPGILAQSIGGGGGNAGDGVGNGGGGKISVNVAIGGSGGAGGDGGSVIVDAGQGAILTAAANSPAIFGQSVGGGGGNGGNATTGSGNDPKEYYPQWLATQGADALGNDAVTQINEGFWDWKETVTNGYDDLEKLNSLFEGYKASNDEEAPEPEANGGQEADFKIDIGAGRAGNGGAAGGGGSVNLTNNGAIQTLGSGSYGMFGQSVGAGGGTGGAATAASTNDRPEESTFAAAIGLGGKNGSRGDGGFVTLTNGGANTPNASIATTRDLAHAMYGLSVGGGGGVGGASKATTASAPGGLSITMGADAASGGAGGAVQLDNDGHLTTNGNDAYGMFAQSIGGGGGFASLTGQVYDALGFAHSATNLLSQNVAVQLTNPGAGSNGGTATVNLHETGTIATSGVNAFGIFAQSIGGGGGVAVVNAVSTINASCDLFQSCANEFVNQNNGGNVFINTDWGSSITTTGAGAAGIVAQTIGGGGLNINGLRGVNLLDTSHINSSVPDRGQTGNDWNAGDAGAITMQVNSNITTTGNYAHGILAQAAQNGGGILGREDGYGFVFFGLQPDNRGTSCGNNSLCAGHITVSIGDGTNPTTVAVSGASAIGVAGISVGGVQNSNSVHIIVNQNARILATGKAVAGVLVAAQYQGILDNAGLIDGSQSENKVAVTGWGGSSGRELPYTVNNSGVIRGSVTGGGILKESGSLGSAVTINNLAGGLLEAGPELSLGSGVLNNAGALSIGGRGQIAKTVMTGSLIQQAGGTLHIDADLAGGQADRLEINGAATLGGTVVVAPTTVSNKPVSVLTATEGVTLVPELRQTDSSALFDFPVIADGNELRIQPVARLADAASNLGGTKKAVATNLQRLFDSGASMDGGFTALSAVGADEYSAVLDALAGQALGAIGAFRYNASRAFANNLTNGCNPESDRAKTDCVWARAYGTWTQQDQTVGSLGYHADAIAFQLGAEHELSSNLSVAVAAAYQSTKFRDDGRTARVKGDGVIAGASLKFVSGQWSASAALDAGYDWFRSKRTIAVGGTGDVARAKPREWGVGLHSQVSYMIDLSQLYVKPSLNLHAIRVRANSYLESGNSPFNLAVEGKSDTWLSGGFGIELGSRVPLGNGSYLKPYLGGEVDVSNDPDWVTTARFASQAGGSAFTARTAVPGTLKRIRLGVDLLGAKNVDLSVQYVPEFGDRYTSQTGVAKLTYRF